MKPKKADEDLAEWYERENQKAMEKGGEDEMPDGQKAIKLTLNAFDYIGFIADHFFE